MTLSVSSPVTGLVQTGLTNPTYTLTADVGPNAFSRQWAVTALGGTQTLVRTHAASDPFTYTAERPATLVAVPVVASGATLQRVGRNDYKIRTRKGVVCVVGQAPQVCIIETRISIPAGSDTADPINIRAALSLHGGVISQISSAIGDTAVTGLIG
jgi:hypothetical protein